MGRNRFQFSAREISPLFKANYNMIFRKLNIGNIYRKWYEGHADIVHINVLLHSIVDVMEKGEREGNVGRLGGCGVG